MRCAVKLFPSNHRASSPVVGDMKYRERDIEDEISGCIYYMCMYIYVYIYMYVCIYIHMYIYICVYIYTQYAYMYVLTFL